MAEAGVEDFAGLFVAGEEGVVGAEVGEHEAVEAFTEEFVGFVEGGFHAGGGGGAGAEGEGGGAEEFFVGGDVVGKEGEFGAAEGGDVCEVGEGGFVDGAADGADFGVGVAVEAFADFAGFGEGHFGVEFVFFVEVGPGGDAAGDGEGAVFDDVAGGVFGGGDAADVAVLDLEEGVDEGDLVGEEGDGEEGVGVGADDGDVVVAVSFDGLVHREAVFLVLVHLKFPLLFPVSCLPAGCAPLVVA